MGSQDEVCGAVKPGLVLTMSKYPPRERKQGTYPRVQRVQRGAKEDGMCKWWDGAK